ncbi:diguanylate cyclase [Allohahella marinimesophila]|uniref:diguanylate cyclase n=1 Tax=Allohahella marinimesophila TaxID=1054972 RepID=A0ABP7PED6_9GAMM
MLSDRERKSQRRRERVALSTSVSYMLTWLTFAVAWAVGVFPGKHLAILLLMTAFVSIGFWLVFRLKLNLRFRDKDLTAEQMALSLIPPLYALFFLENPQARSSILLIIFIPLVYGILGLRRQQFIRIGILNFLFCILLIGSLWWLRPAYVDLRIEAVQLTALLVVIGQLILIGGYISELRNRLKKNNIQLEEALETIQEMASTDELTGLSNRRALMEKIEQEFSRCTRGGPGFSVCLIDVDFFKRINDTFGHHAGDQVLRELAQMMKDCLRKIDCVGRFGGEEFLLVLPQTALEGAVMKAERLRQAVEGMRFDSIEQGLTITISIGVAQYDCNENFEQTIARADTALYAAKNRGRNQTRTELDIEASSAPA